MFDKERILTCGASLVGFREDNNPIYASLGAALKMSSSGLWFNDLPGVNFEMVDANLLNDIAADDYLSNVVQSELISLVNQFIHRSKQLYNSKELIARQSIVSGVASMNNKVIQNQRFVGYWIRPHKSSYLRTEIVELGFQATAAQAEPLKIYLYETSQLDPVATFEYEIDTPYSLIWRKVTDFLLYYESEERGTGQEYLLGYYEKDLSNPQNYQLQSQGLYMEFDCNCNGSPKTMYGKYLGIEPIEINNQYLNFNADENEYFIPWVDNLRDFTTSQTYGLSAKINVTCDITDVICQNIGIFAHALQHAVCIKILYDAYASTRINSISDSKREQALQFAKKYDGKLNGYIGQDGQKIRGLIDSLTVDFSSLDEYCLPCKTVGIMKGHLVR